MQLLCNYKCIYSESLVIKKEPIDYGIVSDFSSLARLGFFM